MAGRPFVFKGNVGPKPVGVKAQEIAQACARLLLNRPNPASPLVQECARIIEKGLRAAESAACKDEREACAKLVETLDAAGDPWTERTIRTLRDALAAAIRARAKE